ALLPLLQRAPRLHPQRALLLHLQRALLRLLQQALPPLLQLALLLLLLLQRAPQLLPQLSRLRPLLVLQVQALLASRSFSKSPTVRFKLRSRPATSPVPPTRCRRPLLPATSSSSRVRPTRTPATSPVWSWLVPSPSWLC
ncbi:hypothetical protein LTS18_003648, partial [Coniosporium uncinatum]